MVDMEEILHTANEKNSVCCLSGFWNHKVMGQYILDMLNERRRLCSLFSN